MLFVASNDAGLAAAGVKCEKLVFPVESPVSSAATPSFSDPAAFGSTQAQPPYEMAAFRGRRALSVAHDVNIKRYGHSVIPCGATSDLSGGGGA